MTDPTAKLSLEIWAKIFSYLEPDPHANPYGNFSRESAQCIFWQLPLVCRSFNKVFAAHPTLGQDIILPRKWKYPKQRLSSSLIKWLQARASVIRSFELHRWSQDLALYLRALSHASSNLTHIVLKPRSVVETQQLSSFTALTSCCLRSAFNFKYGIQDLAPLQGLQHLKKLQLQNGSWCNLSAANHLTELDLGIAIVSSTARCALVTSLIKLRSDRSEVHKLHEKGLLACTALQSLHVVNRFEFAAAHMSDVFRANCLDCRASVPFSFSSLVSLTELHISSHSQVHEHVVDFSNIGSIPNLSSLHLSTGKAIQIGRAFVDLTRLTKLFIGHESCLRVPFDCHMLPMLRALHIACMIHEPVPALFPWADRPCLTELSFKWARPSDRASMLALQAVGRFMATHHPDVLYTSYDNSSDKYIRNS